MLKLIEDRRQKNANQRRLVGLINRAWREREVRQIAWRPSSREVTISHNRRYWFGTVKLSNDDGMPRYWNAFGKYSEVSNLHITVETNIPTDSNSNLVAGFFATDQQTGSTYLMHDAAIGGGRRGIGRKEFLRWSGDRIVQVERSSGTFRRGLVVAPLRDVGIGAYIERFIAKVSQFKEQAAAGAIEPSATESPEEYSEYFPEFFGIKRGERKKAFEYLSRHGEIVHALSEWRKSHLPHDQGPEKIVKNAKIDLGVLRNNKLVEIYEVKTNAGRQTLYTAIGQLLVHGVAGRPTIRRFLVLPKNSVIPKDVSQAVKKLGIELLRFDMTKSVSIVG